MEFLTCTGKLLTAGTTYDHMRKFVYKVAGIELLRQITKSLCSISGHPSNSMVGADSTCQELGQRKETRVSSLRSELERLAARDD